ncbi:MAG: hypothetical protein DWQ02_28650 [Bacteroidetes bacterium]|nr:MAG: hypothetical protein DWQ02_28650 [Bacteroidota bacterium]
MDKWVGKAEPCRSENSTSWQYQYQLGVFDPQSAVSSLVINYKVIGLERMKGDLDQREIPDQRYGTGSRAHRAGTMSKE